MTDEQLAEIRARLMAHQACPAKFNTTYPPEMWAYAALMANASTDISALLAEVDWLREEVVKWRDEYQDAICGDYDD